MHMSLFVCVCVCARASARVLQHNISSFPSMKCVLPNMHEWLVDCAQFDCYHDIHVWNWQVIGQTHKVEH